MERSPADYLPHGYETLNLAEAMASPVKRVRVAVATYASLTEDELLSLASDEKYLVRLAVASRQELLPASVIEVLRTQRDVKLLRAVLRHVTDEELTAEINHSIAVVRFGPTGVTNDPIILAAQEREKWLRMSPRERAAVDRAERAAERARLQAERAAERARVEAELAVQLAAEIAADLAERERVLSSEEVDALIAEYSTDSRLTLARNRTTPPHVLASLAHTLKAECSELMRQMEMFVPEYELQTNLACRREVAENPATPAATLEEFSLSNNAYLRGSLARNPSIPSELLKRLAADEKPFVRKCVAENPKTPETLIRLLARDESASVRKAVTNRDA